MVLLVCGNEDMPRRLSGTSDSGRVGTGGSGRARGPIGGRGRLCTPRVNGSSTAVGDDFLVQKNGHVDG